MMGNQNKRKRVFGDNNNNNNNYNHNHNNNNNTNNHHRGGGGLGSNAGSPTQERSPFQFHEGGGDNRRRGQHQGGGNRGGRGQHRGGGPPSRSGSFSSASRPSSSHSSYNQPQHNAPQQQHQHPSTSRPSTPSTSNMPPPTPMQSSGPSNFSSPTSRVVIAQIDPKAGLDKLWDHVTGPRLEAWNVTGRNEVIAEAIELSSSSDPAKRNIINLIVLLQEILQATTLGRIGQRECTSLLIELITTAETARTSHTSSSISSDLPLSIVEPLIDCLALYEKSDGTVDSSILSIINSLLPNYLPIDQLRLAFGLELLGAVDPPLVTNPRFKRRINQVSTKLLYRTTKYNLLREETEGYSKLITELYTAGYSASPLDIVEQTMNNVKSMIGYFDLDPNRVLDILLDVAANSLVANHRFFVQLLKESPWWPASVSTKKTPLTPEERSIRDVAIFERIEKEGLSALLTSIDGEDILSTRPGNKTAAQMMGFKFRYYNMPDTDPSKDQIPENLSALAALLIKIGFISFVDLYAHLDPDDESISAEFASWKKSIDERGRGGRINALAMAGSLTDDTLPPSRSTNSSDAVANKAAPVKKEEETKPEIKRQNQKLMLLKHLLSIGALPESLFILGKFPNLVYSYPEIADHIHRLVHHALEPLYASLRPLSARPMSAKKVISTDPALKAAAAPLQALVSPPPHKTTKALTPFFDRGDKVDHREYKFFWDDWASDIPLCQNEQHLRIFYLPLIKGFCGTKFAKDPKLIGKITRIAVQALKGKGVTSPTGDAWFSWIASLFLPVVSVSGSNPGVGNEIYDLMKLYPIESRFSLYGHWTNNTQRLFPEVKSKNAETIRETRSLMKRLSTSNVKLMARMMSKISYANPVTVFNVVLGQVETYDNLIECVVDSARYFSNMGMDAFSYAILVKLSEERGRIQQDGMLVSKWLQGNCIIKLILMVS